MRVLSHLLAAVSFAASGLHLSAAWAAERWQEGSFPPPNGGRLVYAITAGGNPACVSYDGASCLWGKTTGEIDFAKVRPLVCGADHRKLYGVTGFEDPKHWCNLALGGRSAPSAQPAPAPPPPAAGGGGPRLSDWSGWSRAADVDYRYRVRWDPATGGPGKTIEAIFEVRNPGSRQWSGSVRSADCARGTLWDSTNISVGPRQTREASVRGPNCGSANSANIRPGVAGAAKNL